MHHNSDRQDCQTGKNRFFREKLKKPGKEQIFSGKIEKTGSGNARWIYETLS